MSFAHSGDKAKGSSPRPLAVVSLPIETLHPDPRNPRTHSPKQIRQIARSIESFGFNVPILVDRGGNIIAGHGRLLACQTLGWTEVPTLRLEHLSEAQARAFMIADNRLTDTSVWDDRLLAEQLRDLSVLELDFDLEVTGFEMGEIDLRIESLSQPDDAADPADTLPEPAAGPAVTRLGDLWQLGRHRVLCGNALDADAFALLMDSKQAAMVFTDPPYNVPIAGHVSGLGAVCHREFPMASGEMDETAFTAFLTTTCRLMAEHSAPGSLQLVCMDWRHTGELLAAGRAAYAELKNLCVWVKHNAGMGSLYRSQHELIFVFKRAGGRHRNNVELGRHGRHRTNVWHYPGANSSFGRTSEEGDLLAMHPTVKPVRLVADAILDCTARGGVVLDPFLGSGTAVLAAERTGRRCYGLELDPGYVDTIIRRWQAATGEPARHAATGRTFDDVFERGRAGDDR